jgi:hypothetical protein
MKIVPNKQTKRLRISLIILYLVQVFLCTSSYFYIPATSTTPEVSFTILSYYMYVDVTAQPELGYLAFALIPVFIIPIVLFFMIAIDQTRGIGFAGGLIGSVVAALYLLYGFGIAMMDYGAIFAMLLYVLAIFLSILGLASRYLKT